MSNDQPHSAIADPRVTAVIERLQAARRRPADGGPRRNPQAAAMRTTMPSRASRSIPSRRTDLPAVPRAARHAGRRIRTSIGMSTLYFAAAIRDNGGGAVIGSEIVPAKVATREAKSRRGRPCRLCEIREGDARKTLRDLGGPVDFILIDGWPGGTGPTLARQVIEITAPQLHIGGYVMNDNAEEDSRFVRDPERLRVHPRLPLRVAPNCA